MPRYELYVVGLTDEQGAVQSAGSWWWCWSRKRWYRKSFPGYKLRIRRQRKDVETDGTA